MREILYRGIPKSDIDRHFFADIWKDNCEGSFVYGSLIIDKGKYYICVSAMCKINCCINNGMTSMIEVIPETVGQYTGLTDKNGKKIFEGDILRTGTRMGYILFEKGCFRFRWKNFDKYRDDFFKTCIITEYGSFRELEVIGNIHDNPDMLKGGGEG